MIPETPSVSDDEDSDDDVIKAAAGLQIGIDTVITHRVVFKCIGTTKELCYQERLAKASQLMNKGEAVLVKIKPEPDNAVDSKAIIFQCKLVFDSLENSWMVCRDQHHPYRRLVS